MSLQDTDYWDIAHQIMEYAVDVSNQSSVRHAGKPILEIDEVVFLTHLYALRDQEDFESSLINKMLHSNSVVCLVGSRGAGKTSALRYSVNRLKQSGLPILSMTIDIKRIFNHEALRNLDVGAATTQFRHLIREQAMSHLFPNISGAKDFIAWALAGNPDESDSFDRSLVSDLYDQSMIIISEAQATRTTRLERRQALRLWLENDERRYASVFRQVSGRLRAAHVVQAATRLLPKAERVLLIYDNVDRIPAKFQPAFLEEVNDSQLSMGDTCTSVIAIRKENVRALEPRAGAGGDFLAYIGPQSEEYPAVLLPRTSADHIKNVLELRHQFSINLYHKHFGNPEAKRELGDVILERALVHTAVVKEFIEHSVQALANGSVRTIVAIYNAFIRYLLILERREILSLDSILSPTEVDEKHLQTLFFLWLKEMGHAYDIPLYDIHKRLDFDQAESFYRNASEHHLLLTCVLNLSPSDPANENKTDYPTFATVCTHMKSLGFSLRNVKNALGEMCARPGEQPRTLEFFESECSVDDLVMESAERLRLTPLGRELVSEVFSKVGYVWGFAYDQAPEEFRKGGRSYHEMDTINRISVLYEYANRRTRVHLLLMGLLAREWIPEFGDNWLATYRRRFGVGRKLQIERILVSAERFYAPVFAKFKSDNIFTNLRESYLSLLTNLERGHSVTDLDFEELDRSRNTIIRLKRIKEQRTRALLAKSCNKKS
jgi:hypothetical protein